MITLETMNYEISHSPDDISKLLSGSPWLDFSRFRTGNMTGYHNGCFGHKAANHSHVEYVYHEVAHALDFILRGEVDRIQYECYLFHRPLKEILGTVVCEPETLQATEREIRTVAIQFVLLKNNPLIDFNEDEFLNSQAQSMYFLPDFFLVPTSRSNSEKDRTQRRIDWIREKMQESSSQFCFEDLKAAWPHVLNRIDECKEV
jgi:hypothetical protein